MNKKSIIYIVLYIYIFLSVSLGESASVVKCFDNATLQTNTTYSVDIANVPAINFTISKPTYCNYGCDDVTNTCSPSQLNMTLWATGGIFGFLIVIGLLIKLWKGR